MSYQIETRKKAFTAIPIGELLPTPHLHSDIEMIYLKKGESVVRLDEAEYVLTEGSLFFAFPNQIHAYFDRTKVEGYLVIFAPDLFRELKAVFQTKLPEYPIWQGIHSNVVLGPCIQRICDKLATGDSFDEIAAKGYLLTILGEVFADMPMKEKLGDQDTVKQILAYCIENYTKPITLDILAKELYLSKYYISHIFHERMQVSLNDFVNRLRVEYSCSLLEKGCSITDVAYASGFSSVRTYNRAFLKHMGMAPREYVKNK